MRDWATKLFASYGLRFPLGRPKGEYELKLLFRLLEDIGFEITPKGGSKYVALHPKLMKSPDFPAGAFQIHQIHPGSKNKPMVNQHFVRDAWIAVDYLHQIGAFRDDSRDD